MNIGDEKLTTVRVSVNEYDKFKINCIKQKTNFKKVVAKMLHLINNYEDIKYLMTTDILYVSGSLNLGDDV